MLTCSENAHTNYATLLNPTSHNSSLHTIASLTAGDEISIGISGGSNVQVLGSDLLLNDTVFTMQSLPVSAASLVTQA